MADPWAGLAAVEAPEPAGDDPWAGLAATDAPEPAGDDPWAGLAATDTPAERPNLPPIRPGDAVAIPMPDESTLTQYAINPARSGFNRLRQGVAATLHAPGSDASVEDIAKFSVRMADLSRQTERFRPTGHIAEKLEGVAKAKGFGEAGGIIWDNPEILVPVVVESLAMFTPALLGTAAVGAAGPIATAVAAGLGSGSIEFSASLVEEMAKAGGDPTDPMSWAKALRDRKVMEAAYDTALTRGAVIGSFDAVTAGLAGKFLAGAKEGVLSPVMRTTGEVLMQMAGGGVGEATAQWLSGQEFKPGEVLLETVAEGPTAAIEAPGNVQSARASAQMTAAEIEADAARVYDLQQELEASRDSDGAADPTLEAEFKSETDYFYGRYGDKALKLALDGITEPGYKNPNAVDDASASDVTNDPLAAEGAAVAAQNETSEGVGAIPVPGALSAPGEDLGAEAESDDAYTQARIEASKAEDAERAAVATRNESSENTGAIPAGPPPPPNADIEAIAQRNLERAQEKEAAGQELTPHEASILAWNAKQVSDAQPAIEQAAAVRTPQQIEMFEGAAPSVPETGEVEVSEDVPEADPRQRGLHSRDSAAQFHTDEQLVEERKALLAEEPEPTSAPRRQLQEAAEQYEQIVQEDAQELARLAEPKLAPDESELSGRKKKVTETRLSMADGLWVAMEKKLRELADAGYDVSKLHKALSIASGSSTGRRLFPKIEKGGPISGRVQNETRRISHPPKGGWEAILERLYADVGTALGDIAAQPQPLPQKPADYLNNHAWVAAETAGLSPEQIRALAKRSKGEIRVGDVKAAVAAANPETIYELPTVETVSESVEDAAAAVRGDEGVSDSAREVVEGDGATATPQAALQARLRAALERVELTEGPAKVKALREAHQVLAMLRGPKPEAPDVAPEAAPTLEAAPTPEAAEAKAAPVIKTKPRRRAAKPAAEIEPAAETESKPKPVVKTKPRRRVTRASESPLRTKEQRRRMTAKLLAKLQRQQQQDSKAFKKPPTDITKQHSMGSSKVVQRALFEDTEVADIVLSYRKRAAEAIHNLLPTQDELNEGNFDKADVSIQDVIRTLRRHLHKSDPYRGLLKLIALKEKGGSSKGKHHLVFRQLDMEQMWEARDSRDKNTITYGLFHVSEQTMKEGGPLEVSILTEESFAATSMEPGDHAIGTLLHEIVHAYSAAALTTDNAYAAELHRLYDETVRFVEWVAGQDTSDYYGLTNVDEFLTEALTNATFQELLAMVPDPESLGSTNTSILTKMLEAIARIFMPNVSEVFGVNTEDTVLASVMIVSPGVFVAPSNQEMQWAGIASGELTTISDSLDITDDSFEQDAYDELFETIIDSGTDPVMYESNAKLMRFSQGKDHASQAIKNSGAKLLTAANEKVEEHLGLDTLEQKNNVRRAVLGFSTTEQIVSRFKSRFSIGGKNPLASYWRTIKEKVQIARRLQQEAERLNQEWKKLERTSKAMAQALSQLMHDATVSTVHPDLSLHNPLNAHVRKSKTLRQTHAKLKRDFNALSPAARAIYRKVQRSYANQRNSYRQATLAHIANVWGVKDILGKPAFDAIVRATDAKAIEAIDFTAMQKDESRVREALRNAATMPSVKGPYFPLRRYGKYVVEGFKTRDGKKFTKRNAAWEEARDLRTDDPTLTVVTKKDDASGLYYNVITDHVVQMADGETGVGRIVADLKKRGFVSKDGTEVKGTLKDNWKMPPDVAASNLLQMAKHKFDSDSAESKSLDTAFLQMLLDTSIRKSEMKRKNVSGASMEMRRAFAERSYAGSWALADVTTALNHRNAMSELDRVSRNDIKLREVVAELQLRDHKNMKDRSLNMLERRISKAGFVWYLASPSYSLINLTQVPLVAQPYLAAKFGQKKTNAALYASYGKVIGAAMKEWAAIKGGLSGQSAENVIDKIREQFNAGERQMIDELIADGVIDATFMQELSETAQGRGESTLQSAGEWVMNVARTSPQVAELINRTVVARTAYDLALNSKGGTHESAVEAASAAVYKTQFDYSDLNKPRYFKFPGGRALMMFKMYGQGMWALFAGNLYRSFKGDNKAEARKTIGGLMLTHSLAGGIFGGILIEPVRMLMSLAEWVGEDEDDPWDMEYEMTRALADFTGSTIAAELLTRGLGRAAQVDIASRLSLGNMLFMPGREGRTTEEDIQNALIAGLGPVFSAVSNVGRGLDYIEKGEYQRGIELMVPKGVRDVIKAERLQDDGLRDYNSGLILNPKEYGLWDTFVQGAGFTSRTTAKAYEERVPQQRRDLKLKDRRKRLLLEWRRSDSKGDFYRKNIIPWNRTHYTDKNLQLSIKSLLKSIKATREKERAGVYNSPYASTRQMSKAYR